MMGATGEFDPLGTAIVIFLIIAFAWITQKSYLAVQNGSSIWWVPTLLFGGLTVIAFLSMLINLAVALGAL